MNSHPYPSTIVIFIPRLLSIFTVCSMIEVSSINNVHLGRLKCLFILVPFPAANSIALILTLDDDA